MSSLLKEKVIRMRPMSMAVIEKIAHELLEHLSPLTLRTPGPLNIERLIESDLAQYGIHIYAASAEELDGREGATDSSGKEGDEIIVLVDEDQFDKLFDGGPEAYRPRATVAHELGHVVLHVGNLRRRCRTLGDEHMLLSRVARQEIKAYEDPEWQAWAFAGCLLAPRTTLQPLVEKVASLDELAETYQVSAPMMKNHLRRLKLSLRGGPLRK